MTARDRMDALPTPLLARAATPYVALSGTANVVLQLSHPAVGRGVRESRVEGARLFDDHRRRRRTTVGYLAVAVHGSASERAAYRRETNASHAQVRSLPGEEPVYSAFDPQLQRWVAACLYHGFEEAYVAVHGPLGEDAGAFYAEGVILGAMLQMPADLWPADRAAFEEYWRAGLSRVAIDEATRTYLLRVIDLEYLEHRVPRLVVQRRRRLTTGFLPPEVRVAMDLPWTAADETGFARSTSRFAAVVRRLPARARAWPFDGALRDVRARLADGRPLFADPD
ncbi:oxygenase MpaB family protein [soil metagenome]